MSIKNSKKDRERMFKEMEAIKSRIDNVYNHVDNVNKLLVRQDGDIMFIKDLTQEKVRDCNFTNNKRVVELKNKAMRACGVSFFCGGVLMFCVCCLMYIFIL